MRNALRLLLVLLPSLSCAEAEPPSEIHAPEALVFPWAATVPPSQLNGTPYAIAAQAAELVHRYASLEPVWPGFDIPTEFILCIAGGGTLLALQRPPQIQASAIDHPSGERFPVRLYYAEDRLYGLGEKCTSFNYTYLEGKSLLAWPQYDGGHNLSDPADATAAAVIHEEFHRYQMRRFDPLFRASSDVAELAAEVVTAPEFLRIAAGERAVLARALLSDTSTLRRDLRQYLVLRDQRMRLAPEWLLRSEEDIERIEGSAHLVGYQGLFAARGGTVADLTRLVLRDLETSPVFDENSQTSWYRHWHIYATGSALGLLLDRLGIEWRAKMEAGATFVDFVRAVVEQ